MFGTLKKWYKNHREAMASVTDQEVISLALENNGRLTSAVLMAHSSLSKNQAGMKLNAMHGRGIFRMDYDMKEWINVYVLTEYETLRELMDRDQMA